MAGNKESPPVELVLYTDGASRGNPGPAGAGVHITDARGETLAERYEYLGECTNNVAEYRALLMGIEEVAKFTPRRTRICLDSELVVKQLNGDYRVRNRGLMPFYRQAREMLAGLGSYELLHVPREKNRRADRLANLALDQSNN